MNADTPEPEKRVLSPHLRVLAAQRSLLAYCARMIPGFDSDAAHTKVWCDYLEQVAAGARLRLILTGPPGHGKSTLATSQIARLLGMIPRFRVLLLSSVESLAVRNSRWMRDQVRSELWPFPDVKLETDSVLEWHLSNGSGIRVAGITGNVTGWRCEMLFLDDVQSDHGTSESRNSLERFVRSEAITRVEAGYPVVAICTRWGSDDLVARLLEGDGGSRWLHINLPAIALDEASGGDPYLHREPGAALWPKRWSLPELETRRVEVGPIEFDCQFQGDPQPEGGAIFKEEWMQQRYAFGAHPKKPEMLRIVQRYRLGLVRIGKRRP
jgi:hypothetical protein